MLLGLYWAGLASVVRHILTHAWPPWLKFAKILRRTSGPSSALETLDLRVASLVYGVLHLAGLARVVYNIVRYGWLTWPGLACVIQRIWNLVCAV